MITKLKSSLQNDPHNYALAAQFAGLLGGLTIVLIVIAQFR